MVAICGVLILSLLLAAAWYFPRGNFLSVSEVCRRWGGRPLDVAGRFGQPKGTNFRAPPWLARSSRTRTTMSAWTGRRA